MYMLDDEKANYYTRYSLLEVVKGMLDSLKGM